MSSHYLSHRLVPSVTLLWLLLRLPSVWLCSAGARQRSTHYTDAQTEAQLRLEQVLCTAGGGAHTSTRSRIHNQNDGRENTRISREEGWTRNLRRNGKEESEKQRRHEIDKEVRGKASKEVQNMNKMQQKHMSRDERERECNVREGDRNQREVEGGRYLNRRGLARNLRRIPDRETTREEWKESDGEKMHPRALNVKFISFNETKTEKLRERKKGKRVQRRERRKGRVRMRNEGVRRALVEPQKQVEEEGVHQVRSKKGQEGNNKGSRNAKGVRASRKGTGRKSRGKNEKSRREGKTLIEGIKFDTKGSSEGREGSRKTGAAHMNRKDETSKQDTPKENEDGEAFWNEKGEKDHRVSMRSRFNFMADVVERTAPAVVQIEVFQRSQSGDSEIPVSSGSGFLLSPSGLAITNAHLILAATNWAGPGEEQIIRARLRDGHALATSLTQMDARLDIAALHLHSEDSLPYLPLGHSASVRPGEFVLALGSPLALPNTVTAGVVSSVARRGHRLGLHQADLDFIQTDATINFGNSGGPLVNMDGEVIGMNSLKVAAGISFAIPADRIQMFLSHSHGNNSEESRQFIGIRMLTLTPSLLGELSPGSVMPDIMGGVYIHDVIVGSPAYRAGLKAGDVVVLINGKTALSANQLQEAVAASRILLTKSHMSTPIDLLVLRGSETLAIAVMPFTLP